MQHDHHHAPMATRGIDSRASLVEVVMSYESFLASKLPTVSACGFEPETVPSWLFAHQRDLVRWAVRRGRTAIFADTGLGKTRMQIAWAEQVHRHSGGDVLILAPLAVAAQTVREGAAVGITVNLCRDGADVRSGINITNYDRLHRFDTSRFIGVVLDESSCIKHHDAKTSGLLIEAFAATKYKLCATATPAPNDYTELGTHAEFLGICSRMEMLSEYFVHDSGETQTWRLKGHAREAFWQWVASWAALIRKPSDLGYDDAGYALPSLSIERHVLPVDREVTRAMGVLFADHARDLNERRAARKGSIGKRVAACAEQVAAEPGERWLVWCELNDEQRALEKAFGDSCVSVYGSLDADEKERRLTAFVEGSGRILLGKPSIFGFGLNLQMLARIAFVGVSDSYESFYQSVRRCWRFGQSRPVVVHVFASEAEASVLENLARKEADAQRMAEELSAMTRDAVRSNVLGNKRTAVVYAPSKRATTPAWIRRKAS